MSFLHPPSLRLSRGHFYVALRGHYHFAATGIKRPAIGKFHGVAPYQIALVHTFRAQADQAFEWLNRAYTERDAGLSEIKGDPLMNPLKHDPRYAALLNKMHLQ
jgi:hypothetical protein